ncbi:hypothetical protein D3C81_2114800 [compost metagenome]
MPRKREQSLLIGYPVPGVLQGVFVFIDLKKTFRATPFIVNVRRIAQQLKTA